MKIITSIRLILLCSGTILILNALMLIAQKKIHLGIALPLIVGLIFVIHALFWHRIQAYLKQHSKLNKYWQALWAIFGIWLCSLLIFAGILINSMSSDSDAQAVKAIIVLGSGIEDDQPTATLAKRLDRASQFAQQQPQAILIVSGGVGFKKKISEAEVMSRYLQTRHAIADTRIMQETKSTSTELNLQYSKAILTQHHIRLNDPVAIVTSDFHILRSEAIAHKQGYQNVILLAAPTPLSIRYNAWLREYFAFISGWVLREY